MAKQKKKKVKKSNLLGLAKLLYIIFYGSAIHLINCLLHRPSSWHGRSSLAFFFCLAHYVQMYNAIVSKCFGKKDIERNHEVLTKIEICNKAK